MKQENYCLDSGCLHSILEREEYRSESSFFKTVGVAGWHFLCFDVLPYFWYILPRFKREKNVEIYREECNVRRT